MPTGNTSSDLVGMTLTARDYWLDLASDVSRAPSFESIPAFSDESAVTRDNYTPWNRATVEILL